MQARGVVYAQSSVRLLTVRKLGNIPFCFFRGNLCYQESPLLLITAGRNQSKFQILHKLCCHIQDK